VSLEEKSVMSNRNKLGTAVLATLTAALVTACGGGGYDGGGGNSPPPAPPAKQAPTISGLVDQSLPQDTSTSVLSFTVADSDSTAASVIVSAMTSDASIIAPTGIVLGGSGASRTLQITPLPEVFGDATITIRAVDPDGLSAQQMVRVTINAVRVSFRDTVFDAFGRSENGEPATLRGFTFTPDADDDPNAFNALLQ
jgi:hypothetical protein